MVNVLVELTALLFTYLFNIPFGYWRKSTRKLSKEWVLAIHLPVPIIFLIRVFTNTPLLHIPIFVLSFFMGQFSGGRIRDSLKGHEPLTRCLILDIIRLTRRTK